MNWLERRESWSQQPEDARDGAAIDYGRVIHSGSFRRLQGKTQILSLGDSDFYRTRLTHSLEVAQIAGGIARQLEKTYPGHPATEHLPGISMIHAIGCTHDLGHPPFGHGGEVALNYCMREEGGFEGNGQTLRILSKLELFSANAGANLTRRSLLGVLKYPAAYSRVRNSDIVPALAKGPSALNLLDVKSCKPPKCYMDSEQDVVDWVLAPLNASDRETFQQVTERSDKHAATSHKSLDCSIMDVADDIAYGVHDLEDAIALGIVSEDTFRESLDEKCPTFLEALKEKYPGESGNDVFSHFVEGLFGNSGTRKRFISRLVHHFISAVEYSEVPQLMEPLVRYRAELRDDQRTFLNELQGFVVKHVIKSPEVQHLEFKGQGMVVSVFEAMQSDPNRLLPRDILVHFESDEDKSRIICDYIAGMTDSYLLKTYERLFSPRMGSVFDKL
ncbi:anti-phage deoxyguanosine triphosphatase [Nisaea sp.]|uniref:anti-phage deoxyguanosine triphosphatase n=1 Tax=Nisaea sp. TaxID=2024842 RepID=UPI0032EBAFBA